MAKRKIIKKTSKAKIYDCDDVEKYLEKAINEVKREIIPRIDLIDKRDKEQFDGARQTIIDANAIMIGRQDNVEKKVQGVKTELDQIVNSQEKIVKNLTESLDSIHTKLDDHIADETNEFKDIKSSLIQITSRVEDNLNHIQDLDKTVRNIKVNGGTYPLSDAIQHIYNEHKETHKKLDDISGLVEPMRARAQWMRATREFIKKNGLLHFIFGTKLGAILGTISAFLIINTIALDVFGIRLDLYGILKAIASLFGKTI